MRGKQQPSVAQQHQRGFAFLALAVLLVLGAGIFMAAEFGRNARPKIDAQTHNARVLAQAKEALLAYSTTLSARKSFELKSATGATRRNRIGWLPCPDLDNSGTAAASCASTTDRLGRLPWRTLGIQDLRDAAGERLWYAVGSNFWKDESPAGTNKFKQPYAAGTLGITTADGTPIALTGAANGAAVAVIFSPGAPLMRSATGQQDRSCAGGACDADDVCVSSPPRATARCKAINYLDKSTLQDNAVLNDPATTVATAFLAGPATRATGEIEVNDTATVVTEDDVFTATARRVANEILLCYVGYANKPQNLGRYPWAGTLSGTTYVDTTNRLFGRVPNESFINVAGSMDDTFTGGSSGDPCLASGGAGDWLPLWRPFVWIAIAERHKPGTTPVASPCRLSPGTDCLRVSAPCEQTATGACSNPTFGVTGTQNKEVVVMISGRALAAIGQNPSASPENPDHYLEGRNRLGQATRTYDAGVTTGRFNDVVIAYPAN